MDLDAFRALVNDGGSLSGGTTEVINQWGWLWPGYGGVAMAGIVVGCGGYKPLVNDGGYSGQAQNLDQSRYRFSTFVQGALGI